MNQESNYTVDSPKFLISLYLGSRNDQPLMSPFDSAMAVAKTAAKFESFSIFEGKGCFRGKMEDILRIDIATDKTRVVMQLADELRDCLDQEGVGICHNGVYVRMTREVAANEIVQARSEKTAGPAFSDLLGVLKLPDPIKFYGGHA